MHILDGRQQGVLADELFSNEVGTMVHADSYRDARALREDDVPELLAMIEIGSRLSSGASAITRRSSRKPMISSCCVWTTTWSAVSPCIVTGLIRWSWPVST